MMDPVLVAEMRRLYESTEGKQASGVHTDDEKWTYTRLMGKYGVSRDTVWKILTYRTWRNVR